jgi:gamma-glutamylaminecyclotransferase
VKIFVYGTLMRGHYNFGVLTKHKAKFLSLDAIPGFILYSLGPYPFITRPTIQLQSLVHGELFECPEEAVRAMDRLEGHPNFYRRETVDLAYSKGEAYAYVMNEKSVGEFLMSKKATFLPTGKWTHDEYKKLERC